MPPARPPRGSTLGPAGTEAPPAPPRAAASPTGGIEHVNAPGVDDAAPLPREPAAAIERLSQLNGPSAVVASQACGAFCVVAATIVFRGYGALGRLVEALADELSDGTRTDLAARAAEVEGGGSRATYGALGAFAQLVQRRFRGFDGGMSWDKLLRLMRAAGFAPPRRLDDSSVARTLPRAGQCWPAKIDLDGRGGRGDHWILPGHDTRGLFLYDPYPRADARQLVHPDEPDWSKYTAAIAAREKGRDTIGFLPPA